MKADYIFPFLWLRDQSEEKLRNEIAKIDECGIASICVESRPHPDFGGPGWWQDLDIVIDEAEKRGMRIWILDDAHFPTGQANSLLQKKYPERARKYLMLQHVDCVGPVPGATLDVNLMMTKAFTWMDFGKPVNKPLVDKQKLLSIVAVPLLEGDIIGDTAIDITEYVAGGQLHWDVPEGVWRICVCFETYDFGARNEYINYIDAKSVDVQIEAIYELHYQHYREKFGNTIAGFFSDEPGFYNVDDFDMNDAIGRKKMALPWCDEFPALIEGELGRDWKKRIPQLWFTTQSDELSSEARKDYMDLVSYLYKKNFSNRLGKWCEEHNVLYIGHVIEDNDEHTRLGCGAGHYFRAVSGQHMAGIDTIGGQIIPGNPYGSRHGVAYVGDGCFNHFVLGKLGASSAQIDPKKQGRTMCEAFGAYGWGLGVKNMKWLVDYLLTQGVNHFVPHAFSMADYPDDDCPPHFYAGGHNPQFPYFAELMKYTNQMCGLFNGGQNVPVVGLLYPAEQDWMKECMSLKKPARTLLENQIDFMILPLDVFTDTEYYKTSWGEGSLRVNNRIMKGLVVPYAESMDLQTARVLEQLADAGVSIYMINGTPDKVIPRCEKDAKNFFADCLVTAEEELASQLKSDGLYDILADGSCPNLAYYHYRKGHDIYLLFNTSLSENVETVVTFREKQAVSAYQIMTGEYTPVSAVIQEKGTELALSLRPYESILLIFGAKSDRKMSTETEYTETDISEGWYVSTAAEIDAVAEANSYEGLKGNYMETLCAFSEIEPQFSGVLKYRKKVRVEKAEKIAFRAEYIYETAELFVNGMSAGKKLTPDYQWDISDLCTEGENVICVEVVNTPIRDTLKNPGIFGAPREILEPSGMFGKIVLLHA